MGVLMKDDVILSVDGHRIANDGTVSFRKRMQASASLKVYHEHAFTLVLSQAKEFSSII